jgi:signal transduction histidine kinase
MRRIARDVLLMIAIAIIYTAVAKISLAAAAAHHVVSSIWPPAGIAVFVLVRFGLRFWPAIAVGAFALNYSNGITPTGALLIAVGNSLEALVAAHWLTHVAKINRALDRVRDVLALVGFAGIVSTMIAATVGVLSLVLTGAAQPDAATHLWLVWWTGDAVGVIVVTPLLLTWTEPESDAPHTRMRGLEQLLTFVALAVACDLLFRRWGGFFYLVFPITTWIALRFGRRGAATASAIVLVIATGYTIQALGPFVQYSALGNLFALQLFLAVLAAKSMLFAASRAETQNGNARLLESESRYQHLSRQLIVAQENERKRVAREVHDELGQVLTAIKMGLSALRARTVRRPSLETERRLDSVNSALDGAIEAVRRIVLRLRPGVLDNLGPLAALEWEVQEFTEQAGLPVELVLPEDLANLDAERSTVLYRTVQEALTNVMRHANAKSVAVGLKVQPGALVLQVTDDGRGIAEDELRKPRSMGILGMRERAMSCGGTLDVRRAAGGGTDVVLVVPYDTNGRGTQ